MTSETISSMLPELPIGATPSMPRAARIRCAVDGALNQRRLDHPGDRAAAEPVPVLARTAVDG